MEKITVGVDIENISKFQDLEQSKDRKFLQKIFTDLEIDYCFQKINPAQHLAVRFAAKEAIMKAFNSIASKLLVLTDIEIKNDDDGKPKAYFKNNELSYMRISLSMSHSDDSAIAFAIILNQKGDLFN
jgi:phosphopantetheine--protein transferase-like protein